MVFAKSIWLHTKGADPFTNHDLSKHSMNSVSFAQSTAKLQHDQLNANPAYYTYLYELQLQELLHLVVAYYSEQSCDDISR